MRATTGIDDLALFGGRPAFDEPLHVGRPNIGNRERLLRRFEEALDRRWLTNDGPLVQELEQRIAARLGVRHCITTCNATAALDIASRAAGLVGEVILPSFTFVATAHALQWRGIRPVFCDIDPKTHQIDPRKVEDLITPSTSGIIGVHLWGAPCDVESLTQIAARHELRVIFDAAHAFACTYKGRMIGGFGDAEVFSFHATKFVSTFEGGAITTNDAGLAEKCRLYRNFGFSGYDTVVDVGINAKMTEIAAAMGLTSLESADEVLAANRRNYDQYLSELHCAQGVTVYRFCQADRNNYQYVVLEVDERSAHIDRDDLVRILHAENVLARKYFYPGCHQMEPYRTLYPDSRNRLRETERVARRVLVLPTGTAICPEQVAGISAIIRFATANGRELKQRLGDRTSP